MLVLAAGELELVGHVLHPPLPAPLYVPALYRRCTCQHAAWDGPRRGGGAEGERQVQESTRLALALDVLRQREAAAAGRATRLRRRAMGIGNGDRQIPALRTGAAVGARVPCPPKMPSEPAHRVQPSHPEWY